MHKIIIPTGYMGSGSSAITDLIREFRGYEASHGSFEYIFLHCPNGIFDLEDKLLTGNNALRSDEAIHSFEQCMKELYYRKFWWPANYKKNLHPDFFNITQEYIKKLVQFQSSYYWYMQEKLSLPMFIRMCFRKLLMIFTAGKITLSRPLAWSPMKITLVEPDEFYQITKQYLNLIFDCMGLQKKNLILDQLLLPFNLWRMQNYFEDNAECFVIERDPRDVFISNKYIWGIRDLSPVPYPIDVDEFCKFYKRLRATEKQTDNTHIHRFSFEDLIYKYDESVAKISQILSLTSADHIEKFKYFDPKKSINNTQLFLKKEYSNEVLVIENKLADYLYDFPYQREVNMSEVF